MTDDERDGVEREIEAGDREIRRAENIFAASRDEHDAVDAVYQFVDVRLRAGRFEPCNELLVAVDPRRLTLAQIVALLIVTRRAGHKGHLPARDAFFNAAHRVVTAARDAVTAGRILGKYR